MKRVRRLAAVILIVFVALVLGEAAVRNIPQLQSEQMQIRHQTIVSADVVVADRELGFLRARSRRQLVKTLDFSFVRETDAEGFPNRGPWPERTDILFLGDSLIMGEGVGLDRGFVSLVARSMPDRRFLNLGVPGAAPDRQDRIFRRYGADLRPGVVLAFLYVAADLTNSVHFSSWLKEAPDQDYNRFRLKFGKMRDKRSYFNPARWLEKSRLVALASSEIRRLREGDRATGVVHLPNHARVVLNLETLAFLRTAKTQSPAFELMVQPLVLLDREVRASGGRFAVVLVPSKEEVFEASSEPVLLNLAGAVKSRLKEEGVNCLDLQPVLTAAIRHGSPYFERDIHLNMYGNEAVAQQLASAMRNGLIPAPAGGPSVSTHLEKVAR